MSEQITVDEWLAEMERLSSLPNNDSMTAQEIASMIGCSVLKARQLIRRSLQDGTIEHCRKPMVLINGHVRPTDAYRFIKAKKSKR